MNSSTRMADEWPLEMNSEREGSGLANQRVTFARVFAIAFTRFDRIRQSLECMQGFLHRSGDGGCKITRDPVPCEQLLDCRQRVGDIVHDVKSGAAVNMKVNVTRRHQVITEIGNRNSGGNVPAVPRGNFEDPSLLDEHERMLDGTII